MLESLGLRPYDVQLIGAMVLNDGNIAEMKTGEGKTLVGYCSLFKCTKWKRCSCCNCK